MLGRKLNASAEEFTPRSQSASPCEMLRVSSPLPPPTPRIHGIENIAAMRAHYPRSVSPRTPRQAQNAMTTPILQESRRARRRRLANIEPACDQNGHISSDLVNGSLATSADSPRTSEGSPRTSDSDGSPRTSGSDSSLSSVSDVHDMSNIMTPAINLPSARWLTCCRHAPYDIISSPLGNVYTNYKPVDTVSLRFHVIFSTDGDGAGLENQDGVITITMRINTLSRHASVITDYLDQLLRTYGRMHVTWILEYGRINANEFHALTECNSSVCNDIDRERSRPPAHSVWTVARFLDDHVRSSDSQPMPHKLRQVGDILC